MFDIAEISLRVVAVKLNSEGIVMVDDPGKDGAESFNIQGCYFNEEALIPVMVSEEFPVLDSLHEPMLNGQQGELTGKQTGLGEDVIMPGIKIELSSQLSNRLERENVFDLTGETFLSDTAGELNAEYGVTSDPEEVVSDAYFMQGEHIFPDVSQQDFGR
jgi:hypothetical protein